MERYLAVAKEHLKFNIWPHILVTACFLMLSPFLLGIRNLDALQTAKVLETYVAIMGIIILPPLFLPEQNQDIRDLIHSKYVNVKTIYGLRCLENMLILALFLAGYMALLKNGNCTFDTGTYFVSTFAEMIAFGGLGIFFYSITDHMVIGYMVPVMYYIAAWGAGQKYMGMFYPFSMMGGNEHGKWYLLAAGLILGLFGIWYKGRKQNG